MDGQKYNYLKILGILGAVFLIAFGSLDNIWRTMKLAWHKISD